MRKYFARVYNSIKLTDNKIGDLLYRLDKNGLRDNTIILFYSDQGEGIPRGKTNGINFGHRVPFVIGFPQKYKNLSPWGTSGTVSGELGDFEDLAPTILSLAGAKMPDYLKGHLELSSDRAHN
ncbi:sulfatase-like hydrolase/transferase [Pricia antarctica]|nr:sulfatase-like hydrolase/transferase [Pricia antarctica]